MKAHRNQPLPVQVVLTRLVPGGRCRPRLGVHPEEALARFAARDIHLSFSEADFLAFVVHGLGIATATHGERYMRLTLGFGEGRRGMLVHNYTIKTFNAVGQITQVEPTGWIVGRVVDYARRPPTRV